MTRTFIIASALIIGMGATAMAQDGGGRRGRGGRGGGFGGPGMGMDELGLSDEQKKQVDGFREEMRAKMMELRQSGDRGAMREAFQEMRTKMDSKMKEILTPEQLEKYTKLQEERQQRFGQRGQRGQRGGRGRNPEQTKADALKALKLEEEAAAVVTPMLDAVIAAQQEAAELRRTQRGALRDKAEGDISTEELTKLLQDYRAARDAAENKLKEARTALRELLTLRQEVVMVSMDLLD